MHREPELKQVTIAVAYDIQGGSPVVRVMIMCNVMLCTSNGKFVEFVDTNGASKNI